MSAFPKKIARRIIIILPDLCQVLSKYNNIKLKSLRNLLN